MDGTRPGPLSHILSELGVMIAATFFCGRLKPDDRKVWKISAGP